MTRFPNSCPIIVVEVDSIFEMGLNKLKENYHSALSNMLGAYYKDAIDHFYFLVTKCDGSVSDEKIQQQLKDIVFDRTMTDNCHPDSTLCTKFFRRMATSFVTVNLEEDDNKSLLKKLTDKIDADKSIKQAIGRFDAKWKIEKLDSGENELNRRCFDYIKRGSKIQIEIEKEAMKLEDRVAPTRKAASGGGRRNTKLRKRPWWNALMI